MQARLCLMAVVFASTVAMVAVAQPPVAAPITTPIASTPIVSADVAPAEVVDVPTPDDHKAIVVVRRPPGDGPFPAVVLLHGGLETTRVEAITEQALTAPLHARCLAAGYVTATPTFRRRSHDPQTRDALVDCLAVVDYVKRLPYVDRRSVGVIGSSGGGSLALELASETELAAIVAWEPASILFTGMFSKENLEGGPPYASQAGMHLMENPKQYYTRELQNFTRAKIRKIACAVLVVHGDVHIINRINDQIVVPELRAAGKQVETILYPGQPHGLLFGSGGDANVAAKCFEDCHAFLKRHLATQPAAIDEKLIERVAVEQRSGKNRDATRRRQN